jgi:cytochrome b
MMTSQKITVKVWDPLIRIGHWTLVAAFFTAYFTEDDLLTAHVWAGYTVGAYLLIRILWGFIGTRHARFRHFIYSPAKTVDYLRNLIARRPQHYIGHNPAGAAMVMALLLSLTATTFTGLKLYAVEEHKGPLALTDKQFNMTLSKLTPVSVASAEDDDDDETASNENNLETADNKKAEAFWEESHEFFANLTLLLVLVHVAGVILSSRIDKENLVKTMITGKKEIDDRYQ